MFSVPHPKRRGKWRSPGCGWNLVEIIVVVVPVLEVIGKSNSNSTSSSSSCSSSSRSSSRSSSNTVELVCGVARVCPEGHHGDP
jgi:hypothetical protein